MITYILYLKKRRLEIIGEKEKPRFIKLNARECRLLGALANGRLNTMSELKKYLHSYGELWLGENVSDFLYLLMKAGMTIYYNKKAILIENDIFVI